MKNRKKKKRSLALLLSLSMVMSTFSGITVRADAAETKQFQFVSYDSLAQGEALPNKGESVSLSTDNQWVSANKDGDSVGSYIAICDVTQDDTENGEFKVASDTGYTTDDFELYLVESWCEANQLEDGVTEKKIDENYLSDVDGQSGVIKCNFPSTALGSYQLRCTKAGRTDKILTLDVNYPGEVELYEKDVPTEGSQYDGDKIHVGGSMIYLAQFETDHIECIPIRLCL